MGSAQAAHGEAMAAHEETKAALQVRVRVRVRVRVWLDKTPGFFVSFTFIFLSSHNSFFHLLFFFHFVGLVR